MFKPIQIQHLLMLNWDEAEAGFMIELFKYNTC